MTTDNIFCSCNLLSFVWSQPLLQRRLSYGELVDCTLRVQESLLVVLHEVPQPRILTHGSPFFYWSFALFGAALYKIITAWQPTTHATVHRAELSKSFPRGLRPHLHGVFQQVVVAGLHGGQVQSRGARAGIKLHPPSARTNDGNNNSTMNTPPKNHVRGRRCPN